MAHDWMQNDQDPQYPKTKKEYGVYHRKTIDGPWELVTTGSKRYCEEYIANRFAGKDELGNDTYIGGGWYKKLFVYIIPGHRGSTALQLVGAKENREPRYAENAAAWAPFLSKYQKAIDQRGSEARDCTYDQILHSLLISNCKYIPFNITHPRFHKNFRQVDITPDADHTIWMLLHHSTIFWDLVQQEEQEEHQIAYVINEAKGG